MIRRLIVFVCLFSFLFVGTASAFSSAVVKTTVQRVLTKACTLQGVPANDNRCLRLVSGANTVLANTLSSGYFLVTKNWLGLLLTLLFAYFSSDKEIKVSSDKTITVDENLNVVKEEVKKSDVEIPVVTDFVIGECVEDNCYTNLDYQEMRQHFNEQEGSVDVTGTDFVFSVRSNYSGMVAVYYKSLKKMMADLVEHPSNLPYFSSSGAPKAIYFPSETLNKTYDVWSSKKNFSGYSTDVVWLDNEGNTHSDRLYFPLLYSSSYGAWDGDESPVDINEAAYDKFSAVQVSYPNLPLDEYIEQAELTENDQAEVLSAGIISDAVNSLWQSVASQADYDGLPYQSGLITSDVVQSVGSLPSLGDAVQNIPTVSTGTGGAPQYDVELSPDTSTGGVIDPEPTPDPEPVPDYDVNVDVDFGPDPGVGSPVLEDIPTAANILDPIFNLFPVLRNFEVPSGKGGECPHLQFTMFGQEYDIGAHCDLLEEQKPVIQSVFALFWLVLALIILLGA